MAWFSVCFRQKNSSQTGHEENSKLYSYRELQTATQNFSPLNKIGEGGFGSVYKGRLKDGTVAAIKVLSAESEQGIREFLTEIMVISGLEHENLVKLYGCCAEGAHRILVYGYLENRSLAQTLLGGHNNKFQFSWKTRTKICLGVAQGLAFLHHEVRPHIIHRDIKASNILLDKDFVPKISDFGLAKIFPASMTHISTRVAGTFGYLAPEYAIRGKLTRKADIYSFGVLLLEIVSGRSNISKRLPLEEQNLLEKAWILYENGDPVQLVDKALDGDYDIEEAGKYLKIGLLCTQDIPKNRPTMSTVARMLKGKIDVTEMPTSKPALLTELMTLKSSSNTQDKSSSSQNTSMTYATMTFSSIYDRSN